MALILTRDDVIQVLSMKDCMEVVEQAFVELVNGTAELPLRIPIKSPDGLSLYMPAYLKEMKALACKVVAVYKDNPARFNLPTTVGKVLLQNPETGEVICIMDGGYLTAVRTGAASGVATKYLARNGQELTVGIFGAGVQAKTQLWAVAEARKIKQAVVFDKDGDAARRFATEMSEKLGIDIGVSSSVDQTVETDIIITATCSPTPLFDGATVRPGTHINGIGSHTPNARELDTEIIKRSKFVGDSREACFKEAGDIMIPMQEGAITETHFYAELGEIITGKLSGRLSADEITLFKSNGLAIQDAATAKLVYDMAKELGVGKEIDL
ncbi:MAG: ornithine cyclodeaminase family protein [Bacteroidales bacterium]|nr:ornithine cyclodeaminase family protein [Bacteroidales bacterium]